MTLVMYDSIDTSQIPADAQAVAGYVDGRFANVAELRDRFPEAHILTIAVFAEHDADCLDIETGDATPGQAAAWFLRQQARGVARPCLYASASVMEGQVLPAIRAAGIARSAMRLWSAHYGRGEHVCGPSSCALLSGAADGTQWTDHALGRNLDQSLLAADFFGTPASNWTETLVNNLPTLTQGAQDHPGATQYVHRVQALVKVIGDINSLTAASAVTADGYFGPLTGSGLAAVQRMFGLTPDEVCGPKTWAALVAGQHG